MLKILITGASSYVGSHLVNRLKILPYELTLIRSSSSKNRIHQNIKSFDYNASSFDIYKIMKKVKPDIVIHLAGFFVNEHNASHLNKLVESNLVFGTKVLDAMREAGVKNFINTSSYWEDYYQNNGYHPVNLYAAIKKSFQDILQYYTELHDFKALTLRLYDIYGPEDPRNKIIPLLIAQTNATSPLRMSLGEQYIDFIHIDDVIHAYMKAIRYITKIKKAGNVIVDIGTGKVTQLKQVVRLIEKMVKHSISVTFGERPYRKREIMKARAGVRYTKKVLQWEAKIPISFGLRKLFRNI